MLSWNDVRGWCSIAAWLDADAQLDICGLSPESYVEHLKMYFSGHSYNANFILNNWSGKITAKVLF